MAFIHPMLTLCVVRYNDEPLAEPIAVAFGPDGGTIGRATTCTLVLPDQQRAISRVHARVDYRAGEYLLCDLGSNPSVLNQRALGGTREARLAAGDQLMIGAYLLDVSIGDAAAPAGERPFAGDPLARASVLAGSPFSESLGLQTGGPLGGGDARGAGGLDALGQASFGAGERISTRPGFAGSESDHVSPEWQAFAPPTLVPPASVAPASVPPAGGGIPADYDPLADALAQWDAAGGAPTAQGFGAVPARHSEPPAGALGGPAAPSPVPGGGGPTGLPASLLDGPVAGGSATPFDDLFAPARDGGTMPPSAGYVTTPASASPSIAQAPSPARTMPTTGASGTAGWLPPESASPDESPSLAAAQAGAAQPAPEPAALRETPPPAAAPMPALAPASIAPQVATSPAGAAPATSPDPTLTALLEGLGLDPSRAAGLAAEDLARITGTMLREAMRGTMAVLRARTMTKREARLDTTLIVERDNNPLKFFPDVDSALAQMLSGRSGGYLPPAEAVVRAFVDIESHELAVLAGMRAALAQVLGRFDPASLEARVAGEGVLDRVLSNRKAKLWDCFVALRAEVVRDADDDFQKLFGRAFNEAYEAQVDAMHSARKGGRPDPA